jgi:integrase
MVRFSLDFQAAPACYSANKIGEHRSLWAKRGTSTMRPVLRSRQPWRTRTSVRQPRARALHFLRLRGADYRSLRPQKSWRTAWRKLVRETARRVGGEAAQQALDSCKSPPRAIAACKRSIAPIVGLRFHDLRHQAITEMAEVGASDATLMAVAGHVSRRMLEHYSHVRMDAERTALEKLESGPMGGPSKTSQAESRKVN